MSLLNSDELSIFLRNKVIDLKKKKILISNLSGTELEKDLTISPNCNGFGRIRHFRRIPHKNWPADPLPIDPAIKALGLESKEILLAEVFQIAACNFRCWYCFVPYRLLAGSEEHARFFSASELLDLYQAQSDSPCVIDLSGGQPELTPEWTLWMIEELQARKLSSCVYLWSDDNLSNDYFWKYLSEKDIERIVNYKNYGRVCCFKGFSEASFFFNSNVDPIYFPRQFMLLNRYISTGLDVYAYVTLTTPARKNMRDEIRIFFDRLQMIDENLPLRTVPLKIQVFTPVKSRLNLLANEALENQLIAVEYWNREIMARFSDEMRLKNITEVRYKNYISEK